jgi:hypothetical protein
MRRIAVSFAVATAAAMGSMTGLAYAGVSLPSQAVAAFNAVGIDLPNQDTDLPDASQHGQEVSEMAKQGGGGCEFGQSISEFASSNRQDSHAEGQRQDAEHRPADVCENAGGTAVEAGNSPGFGKDNHPTGKAPTPAVNGPLTNPTGNGPSTNPTGYGQDNHPTDSTAGQSTNPTGYGQDNHPTGP